MGIVLCCRFLFVKLDDGDSYVLAVQTRESIGVVYRSALYD